VVLVGTAVTMFVLPEELLNERYKPPVQRRQPLFDQIGIFAFVGAFVAVVLFIPQVGLLRMLQAGVIVSDYTTLMVEILKDNARPEAGEVYGAMDMGWARLVGQIAQAYGR